MMRRSRSWSLLMVLAVSVLAIGGAGADEVEGLTWPDSWMMFGPVGWEEAGEVDGDQLREIPQRMEFDGREYAGQTVEFENDRLDIAALLSGHERQDTVFLFGEVHAEREMEVMLGGGADWWMAWWVNGEPVYDTLETGNAGQDFSLVAHTFPVMLREGANVVAIRVSGGREGFLLAAGLPPVERWDQLARVHGDTQRRHMLQEFISEALSLTDAGDLSGARSLLEEALAITTPDEPIHLSLQLRVGENHERAGQHGRAREIYEHLLAGDLPAWAIPVVQSRLAQTLQAAEDYQAARDAFLELSRMSDAHPFTVSGAHIGMADCFRALGDARLAARQYERVIGMTDARPDHIEQARKALEEIAED